MGDFQDILILISFLLEVAVLFYLEMKAWKTLYTPLVFLMVPYVIVLLISIAISGNFGFVEFYYPSILFSKWGNMYFRSNRNLGIWRNKCSYGYLLWQKEG